MAFQGRLQAMPVEAGRSRGELSLGDGRHTGESPLFLFGRRKTMLLKAMEEAGGVQTKAATLLQLSYRSFRHLMKKYDL